MHYTILLSAGLLILAAILWYVLVHSPAKHTSRSPAPPPRASEIAPHTIEALAAAVAALQSLMVHSSLGGPGYLTIRVRQSAVEVTAQYPNIREGLYRRIVRRELAPPELLEEGFPEPLLKLSPEFETESGGMVQITVRLAVRDAYLSWSLSSRGSRQAALAALAAALLRRCSGLAIRVLGGELILTPVQEAPTG